MGKFLTNETPGKIFSLLGAALFSLTLMLAVSASDATFAGSSRPLPDPFSPQALMPVIDRALANYSGYVSEALVNPTKQDLSEAIDTVAWVWDNSSHEVAYITGLDGLSSGGGGRVAGAYTKVAAAEVQTASRSFSIDTLYEVLLK